MRALLLVLHLPLPMIDLRFNFVNSTSPALTMGVAYEQPFHQLFSSDGANHKDVFGLRGTESLARVKMFHNLL